MDFTGGKTLGPIQRDQRPSAQAPEWIEHAFDRDCFEEQRIEYTRRRAVQHLPNMRIRWNGGDAEQGLAIRPPVALFQTALVSQEGCASHEKHRERRKADVGHGVLAVAERPVRWSGRPAQTVFSSAIRDSRAVTAPSGQRSYRVARQNRHTRPPEPRNRAAG